MRASIEKHGLTHGLRHGPAVAQVQSRALLNAIQQLPGQRSPHTTRIYLQHIALVAVVAEATARTEQS